MPPPQKNHDPINIKIWGKLGQLRSLIANISGMKQDIVERKTALQTAISPARLCLIC